MTDDVEGDAAFADLLGLRYVAEADDGIYRRRRGTGWSFHAPDGRTLDGVERERCVRLAIPPAWSDVWICAEPDGHLQSRGRDEATRWQYRYHDRWTEGRRLANFDRLGMIGADLGRTRRRLETIIVDDPDPRRRLTAAMIRMVDRGMARIGGTRSARVHGHHGVSTLQATHVDVDGDRLHLQYVAKSGTERDITIEDGLLAGVIEDLDVGGRGRLFDVTTPTATHRLDASHANALLAELTAGRMTCKDFRTWGASSVALEARVDGAGPVEAVDAAAAALGNTRAVARTSYVHPLVLDADPEEIEAVWSRSRSSVRYDRREQALVKLLDGQASLLGR